MQEKLDAVTKTHEDEAVSVEMINELKDSLRKLKKFDRNFVSQSASSKDTIRD